MAEVITSGVLTGEERARALQVLRESAERFLNTAEQVPPEVWTVSCAEGTWSPSDIAEHLILIEIGLPLMVRTKLLAAPPRDLTEEHRGMDGVFPALVENRTGTRRMAPEHLLPSGRWQGKTEMLGLIEKHRRAAVEYVESTDAPLRLHTVPHPAFGPFDGYQWFLLLASHMERHRKQMEELYLSSR